MPQSVLLKAGGLYTYPNNLSEIPPGALTTADNVVIDKNGIIESRRGFQQYGNTFGIGSDRCKQLMQYKNRLLRHFGTTIQYDDGTGTFTSFSGSFTEPATGLRIKFIEANGNFYFTTAAGIYRISAASASEFTPASGYIRPAGGVQALDLNGTVDYTNGGWFIYQTDQPGQTMVAYRMTWAFNDANGNLVEGAPSSRLVLTNYSETDSANVDLTFQIPSAIASTDTQFFYRIYRTAVTQTSTGVTLATLDPGDEQYLVIEDYPTDAELTSRTVTVTDETPESFRANGSLLYTNPVSGEGILQSNYAPPIAQDISFFQNTVFYSNTKTIQQFNLALLSTSQLVSGTSKITITSGFTNNTYTFVGEKELQRFAFDTKANTTDGGYFLINGPSDLRKYFVWFSKSGAKESTRFTFDTFAATTDGSYFLLNSADNVSRYFIWFDKTGTTAAPSGADTLNKIGIRVSLVGLTTSTQVATAVANVIPLTDFGTTLNTNLLTVTNVSYGATIDASAGAVPPGGGFAILVLQQGSDVTAQPSNADTIGRTGVYVDITQSITAADVANAFAVAINQVVDFTVTLISTNQVTVQNSDNGSCTAAINSAFVPVGGTFSITLLHTGQGENVSLQHVLLGNATSPSVSIDETARSLVKNINANTLETVNAYYVSGPTDLPGLILLQARSLSQGAFSVTADNNYYFTVSPANATTGAQYTNNTQTFTVTNTIVAGTTLSATGIGAPLASGTLTKTTGIGDATITFSAFATTGNEFSPALPTSGTSVSSSNLVELNAIYYSKFQQPEAVPIVNKFLVGPKDKAIVRILPIRTGLMILKEDGIYRLTGTNGQFNIDPFDNSAIILAADSAQVLNNQIYMFSTQGVVTLTDTGVSVISRPIEDQLDRIIAPAFNYKSNTFGVSYESDRSYLLWTVTNSNDTVSTQCFRFNTFTTAWTRWPISKTCGIVKFDEQRLYLGAGDTNIIEQERKNIDRTDYADRQFTLEFPTNAVVNANTVTLSSTSLVDAGDVLVQTQYLTIGHFNQLLKMLDSDPGTGYKDYFSSLGQTAGADLTASIVNLANKLDTDTGLAESDFFSGLTPGGDFPTQQINFNGITSKLIANANTQIKNYRTLTGTTSFDMVIESTIQNTNNVTVQYTIPFIAGDVILTVGIDTVVVWAPQTFGDPSIAKHVSEGTFIFNDTVFNTAIISYASDLMPGFEEVVFNESGIGDWGGFVWDEQYWGGTGSSVPLRTYIPRNKQYCRFIRPKFEHIIAREKFELLGASLTFRPLTERAYRS